MNIADTNSRQILRENWSEFIKSTWFTSFQRAFNLSILLIVLQSILFFAFDYSTFAAGQWKVIPEYRYVYWWRVIYVAGLVPFLLIGRRIKPHKRDDVSSQHRTYLYLFIPFLVFTGGALAVINYKFFAGDLSIYTVSVVLISTMFPLQDKYREVIYILSLLCIFLSSFVLKPNAAVDSVLFTNSTSIVLVSIFIQRLSNRYFQDGFIAIKLIESQSAILLKQKALDLQLLERQKTLESIFYFIHSGPLQTLASTIRRTKSLGYVDRELIDSLERLNHEIRQINDSLTEEMIDDEHSYYLGNQGKVDLDLPFDELLYEVYARTLQRDLDGFRNLKLKLPSFDSCVALDSNVKKSACFFLEEALCNVGKHALDASRLEVVGQQKEGTYTLRVIDNGAGIQAFRKGEGTKRFMKIASELNGTFYRGSVVPRGTLCELKWPLVANKELEAENVAPL